MAKTVYSVFDDEASVEDLVSKKIVSVLKLKDGTWLLARYNVNKAELKRIAKKLED